MTCCPATWRCPIQRHAANGLRVQLSDLCRGQRRIVDPHVVDFAEELIGGLERPDVCLLVADRGKPCAGLKGWGAARIDKRLLASAFGGPAVQIGCHASGGNRIRDHIQAPVLIVALRLAAGEEQTTGADVGVDPRRGNLNVGSELAIVASREDRGIGVETRWRSPRPRL